MSGPKLDSFGVRKMRAAQRDPEGSPPPADEECERALLADILRPSRTGADAFDAIRDYLTAADFSKASHGTLYEAVCAIRDNQRDDGIPYGAIGYPELAAWLRINRRDSDVWSEWTPEERALFDDVERTKTWLEQLHDPDQDPSKASRRARRIRQLADDRRTLVRLWDTAAMLTANDPEVARAAKADLVAHLTDTADPGKPEVEAIRDPLQRVFTRYISNAHTPPDGLSTGFPGLDEVVSLDPGDLVIVGGHPGRGKSSLAMQMAISVGKTVGQVLYFSAEMSAESLALRAACTDAKVDSAKVRRKKLDLDEMRRLTTSVTGLQDCFTWINDRAGLDAARICGIARRETKRLAREHREPVKLIVVDYLQRIGPGRLAPPGSNRETQVGAIAEAFKNLALELGCVVVVPAQLNSDNDKREDKRPDAGDMRESKRIQQEADKILLLYNPCYDNRVRMLATGQTPPPENCEVIVGKNRGGSLGTVHMWFAPVFTAFSDMDPSDVERFVQRERKQAKGRAA